MKLTVRRDRLKCADLMDRDGFGCLLGHYLVACGLSWQTIDGWATPSHVHIHKALPKQARWLLTSEGYDSAEAQDVMMCSDEGKPERAIPVFAKHGVELVLVGPEED